ncbi:hypothetical protein KC329_g45 [Hortaea werneckii]|nr:hypothetical protein KC329_g45 [Hortaea werneckii]
MPAAAGKIKNSDQCQHAVVHIHNHLSGETAQQLSGSTSFMRRKGASYSRPLAKVGGDARTTLLVSPVDLSPMGRVILDILKLRTKSRIVQRTLNGKPHSRATMTHLAL